MKTIKILMSVLIECAGIFVGGKAYLKDRYADDTLSMMGVELED